MVRYNNAVVTILAETAEVDEAGDVITDWSQTDNMLPEEFFFDTAMRIGLIFGIPFVLLFLGSLIGWRRSGRLKRAEVSG